MTERRRPAARPTRAPPAGPTPDHAGAAAWLAAQQLVAARAAHELKNALNGVAVNLAVVQSRLERGAAPETMTRFADAAMHQLERLTEQVEALLAVTRGAATPVNVGAVARQLAGLVSDSSPDGVRITVESDGDTDPLTSTDPDAVRAAVAALVARAAEHGSGACRVSADDRTVRLTVRAQRPFDGEPLPPPLAALLSAAGVASERPAPDVVAIVFPAARGAPAP